MDQNTMNASLDRARTLQNTALQFTPLILAHLQKEGGYCSQADLVRVCQWQAVASDPILDAHIVPVITNMVDTGKLEAKFMGCNWHYRIPVAPGATEIAILNPQTGEVEGHTLPAGVSVQKYVWDFLDCRGLHRLDVSVAANGETGAYHLTFRKAGH